MQNLVSRVETSTGGSLISLREAKGNKFVSMLKVSQNLTTLHGAEKLQWKDGVKSKATASIYHLNIKYSNAILLIR